MTPERIAELRKWDDHCGYKWAGCGELSECLTEIERLRDADQEWVDRCCRYRNIAIEAGAKPEAFVDDDYDQQLAEQWDKLHAHVKRLRAALKPFAEPWQSHRVDMDAEIAAARAAMEETA